MKTIVPFKKEIIFKSNVYEITSISLEHNLHYESGTDCLITGEFIISGDYKMTESSMNVEKFSFDLPFDINMDEKYILDKVIIDIDDFYYEIINNNILSVNIDVLIDKLEEKPLIEKIEMPEVVLERTELPMEEKEEICELEEVVESKMEREPLEISSQVKSLFDDMSNDEEYATYKICIVRENDTIESIMMRYSITREEISMYNDLKEIKIGDKLIIPSPNAVS